MSLGRRSFALLLSLSTTVLLGCLAVSVVWPASARAHARSAVQQAPANKQTPPVPQPAPGEVRFTGDAAFIIDYIKADKAADFEALMVRVKEALARSPVPIRRQQAAGWKIFKTSDGAAEGQVLYVSVIDPVVPGADYSVPKILSEVFPFEARAMYDQYVAMFGRGQVRINGTPVEGRRVPPAVD